MSRAYIIQVYDIKIGAPPVFADRRTEFIIIIIILLLFFFFIHFFPNKPAETLFFFSGAAVAGHFSRPGAKFTDFHDSNRTVRPAVRVCGIYNSFYRLLLSYF